ncbi:MAG: hypothetical protein R3252_00635 [Robiginitalea sp.]|nr:hypothetical protein [Robiginitalea sp.]
MKLTKLQWLTLLAIAAYLIYEFYFVSRWEKTLPESDPVIRGDLVFIYPILLVLVIISVVQFVRKKS